ncbi:MAG: carboxypeptidase regulatory-like domain-containing protein [Candidatus Cloacimonetes bacterium]|nr:carboxypeptidase regulatory-like domain-containing protein [Candidatus Cloacimonadota bacterium]
MKRLFILNLLLAFAASWVIAANVQGTVTDIDTGEAVAGATVRFTLTGEGDGSRDGNGYHHGQGNGGGNGHNVYTTVTDENGFYLLEDITDGVYTGLARKKGEYPSVRIENIELTGDNTINFELTPCGCEQICPEPRNK